MVIFFAQALLPPSFGDTGLAIIPCALSHFTQASRRHAVVVVVVVVATAAAAVFEIAVACDFKPLDSDERMKGCDKDETMFFC